MVQQNESKRGTFEALSLTEDMKFESEQRCLYDQHIKHTPLLEENSVVSICMYIGTLYMAQLYIKLCMEIYTHK